MFFKEIDVLKNELDSFMPLPPGLMETIDKKFKLREVTGAMLSKIELIKRLQQYIVLKNVEIPPGKKNIFHSFAPKNKGGKIWWSIKILWKNVC